MLCAEFILELEPELGPDDKMAVLLNIFGCKIDNLPADKPVKLFVAVAMAAFEKDGARVVAEERRAEFTFLR